MRAGVTLDGEKQFKDAVAGINKDAAVLASEMRKVTAEFANNADAQKALSAQMDVYNKQIATQKDKIDVMRGALENARHEYGENSNQVKEWQIKLNNAEAQLAKTQSAVDNLGTELNESSSDFEKAGQGALKFSDILTANLLSDAIMGGMRALGGVISQLGNALVDVAKDGLDYNAQMESYTASFKTMLGDEAAAQQLVIDLRKEAAATPFGMQDLASATQTLMGFGISATDAQKYMKQLGDISQGNAERFKSLTLAFSQMSATGKLTGQDLNQMINAGFNPLLEMSEKTGKSIAQLKEEMSAGAISADMVAAAFESATSAGGRFYGAMEEQSKTFAGQLATLQDNVEALKGQLTEELTTALADTVMPMVNDWIARLSEALEADGIDGLTAVLGDVLREAVEFIARQAPTIIEAGTGIITNLIDGIMSQLPEISDAAFDAIRMFADQLIKMFPTIALTGVDVITQLLNGIAEALPEIIPAAVNAIMTFTQGLADRLPDILQAGLDIVVGLVQGIINAIPELINALPELITSIVKFLVGAQPQMVAAAMELFRAIIHALPDIIMELARAIPDLIDGIITALTTSDNKDKMGDAGADLFAALLDVGKILEAWGNIVPTIIEGLIEKLTGADMVETFGEVGAEWMSWIIAGFASLATLNPLPILAKIFGNAASEEEKASGTLDETTGGGSGGKRFGESKDEKETPALSAQTKALTTALDNTTSAVESLGVTVDAAAAKAGVKIGDSIDDAAKKIFEEMHKSQALAELTAQAALRAQELMENEKLDRGDHTTAQVVGDDGKIAWMFMPSQRTTTPAQPITETTNINVTVDVSKVKNLNDVLRIADDARRSQRAGYVG